MIVIKYECDACGKAYEQNNIMTIANFPRRIRAYAKDAHGNKLIMVNGIGCRETHLCKLCYNALLNWTCEIEED